MIVGRCGVLWGIFHLQFPLVGPTFAGISSGPEALLGFRACPISRDWIDGNGDGSFGWDRELLFSED